MVEPRIAQIPQAREVIVTLIPRQDGGYDAVATREFYRWMADVQRLVGRGGALETVEGNVVDDAAQIAENAAAIDTANTTIAQINIDLTAIIANLSALATDVSDHAAATVAHGSNGAVAGVGDLPTSATVGVEGLVKKAVSPGVPSFTTVTDAEAWAADLLNKLQTAGVIV